MNFQKIKSNSYCIGGRNRSTTVNFYGDLTSKGSKVLNGYCSICMRKQSMTVSNNTKKAEGLGDFFKLQQQLLELLNKLYQQYQS